jgi:putative Mn2+ efflux pump MntP
VFRLVVTAVALGLSNFAAAIGIGLSGVDDRLRVRIALIFGGFEVAMPIIGVALGRGAAGSLGSHARYVGGLLLVATGCFEIVQSRRSADERSSAPKTSGRLLVTGAALSIDNLVVGFALGATEVSLVVAVVVIGVTSIALSLLGLELGSRIGARVERQSGELGRLVLIVVGLAIAAGVL